jgi:hypothetical protein
MRIGFDFDNTIVSYDMLFHRVAVEQSLVPASLPKLKLAVRDYLREVDKEDAWTELQGCVYGSRMNEAVAYPGVVEFMKHARDNDISMVIVSHKTLHPFMGPKYNLHDVARGWVETFLLDRTGSLIAPEQVFFEVTKEEKIARIGQENCDYFIDDLPEILTMSGFPVNTGRILFDPEDKHTSADVNVRLESWQLIKGFFEGKWTSSN